MKRYDHNSLKLLLKPAMTCVHGYHDNAIKNTHISHPGYVALIRRIWRYVKSTSMTEYGLSCVKIVGKYSS